MPEPPAPPPSPRFPPALLPAARFALRLAVAGLAGYFLFRLLAGVRWVDIASRLAAADRWLVLLAAGLLVLRFSLWDLRFRLAARRAIAARPPGWLFGLAVILAAAAMNLLHPAGRLLAGPLRARSFARATRCSFATLYGAVLYDQLAHQVVTAGLTGLAVLATAYSRGQTSMTLGLALLAVGALGASILLWSQRRGFYASRWVGFLARRAERGAEGPLQRLFAQGHTVADTLSRLAADRGLGFAAAGLSTALFVSEAAAQWAVFRALGLEIGFLSVLTVVALGNTAGMLAGTPGGAGTTEAAMVAAYVALGTGRAEAGAATLCFRGLHYALVLAVGVPALVTATMGKER